MIKVELTQRQAEKLSKFLENYKFSIDDFEIFFIPESFVIIRSKDAKKIIRNFLKNKFNISI